MCRGGKDGREKRCPSHSDERLISQRNERRRELRASTKQRKQLADSLEDSGIAFKRGDAFTDAYYVGNGFERSAMNPVIDEEPRMIDGEYYRGLMKPESSSGVWTSPGKLQEDGTVSTRWSEYRLDEGYGSGGDDVHHVKPMKDAVIVVVDTDEDLERLYQHFPDPAGRLSFAKMADAGIDAFHVTQNAINGSGSHYSENRTTLGDLYGWDMESTLWMNGTFLQKGHAKKTHAPEPVVDDYEEAFFHFSNLEEYTPAGQPFAVRSDDVHLKSMLANSFTYKNTENGSRVLAFDPLSSREIEFTDASGNISKVPSDSVFVHDIDDDKNPRDEVRMMSKQEFKKYAIHFTD